MKSATGMPAALPPDVPALDPAVLDDAIGRAARVLHGFFAAKPRRALQRPLAKMLRDPALTAPGRAAVARLSYGTACLWRRLGDGGAPTGPVSETACRARVTACAALDDPFSAPAPGVLDVETLAAGASFPPAMARALMTADDPWAAAWAYNRPGPMCLRVRAVDDVEPLAADIERAGLGTVLGRGRVSAAALFVARGFNVYAHDPTLRRRYEIQDEGSQVIVDATAAAPGERVLDFCAGRGGKSIGLADRLAGAGEVVAWDIDPARRAHLRRRAAAAGAAVTVWDEVDATAHGSFDVVLVDAPCSAFGTVRRGPDLKWRLDEAALSAFPSVQAAILAQARRFVRPGGRLVYATCTYRPEENDGVARAFSKAAPGLAPEAPWPVTTPGAIGGTLWPHVSFTDGFYIARWRALAGRAAMA